MIQTPANHSSRESFSCPFGALRIILQQNNTHLISFLFFSTSLPRFITFSLSSSTSLTKRTTLLSTFTFSINFFKPNHNGLINHQKAHSIFILSFYHWGTTTASTFYLYYTVAYDSDAKHHHLSFMFSKLPTPHFNALPFYIRQNSKGLTLLF